MPSDAPGKAAAPKRPVGVTILSLVLGGLAASAFLYAELVPSTLPGDFPDYIYALKITFGLPAGVAAVGLWRMRPWALTAFRAWGMVLLIYMISIFVLVKLNVRLDQTVAMEPVILSALLAVTVGTIILVYWWVDRYIRRQLGPAG